MSTVNQTTCDSCFKVLAEGPCPEPATALADNWIVLAFRFTAGCGTSQAVSDFCSWGCVASYASAQAPAEVSA